MKLSFDPQASIGFLMNDVSRLMRRNFNGRAGELGLTQAQWRALALLTRHEGCKQATLADLMEVQSITLCRLIDRLAIQGLVERRPDPKDRRAVRLFLTDAAQPLLERMWTLASETRAEALEGLPPETRDQLATILLRMRENLIRRDAADDSE